MRLIHRDIFKTNNPAILKKLHISLNKIYHNILFGDDEQESLNEKKFKYYKKIESAWITNETRKCVLNFNCNVLITNPLQVEKALHKHSVYDHPLFDYLQTTATEDELKQFILSESILNLEFFDYLALSIIGVSNKAKAEIARNLWDEAGRGKVEKFHTVLFNKFMDDLELHYDRQHIIENMAWEGVAGINLFNYLSMYSFNKMKYFGMLAATEMLDPLHYGKLIQGIKRLYKNEKIDFSYYTEHESIDIEHAKGWLANVVIPELAIKPEKTQEFWLGFYMRLNSAKQYYDFFLNQFQMKRAA